MKTDCCCKANVDLGSCECCVGTEVLTPLPTANRPGLTALRYRIGTHAVFLESMKARLSTSKYPKLTELTTREANDPSLAMLDAWAMVADILTFYQERIANEGYLRTAIERRSVLELGRLVGYKPRPGVAASVYLAYTVDNNFKEETTVPKGSRAQSIPGPGELPQSYETSEELKARARWNNLQPRMTRPQTQEIIEAGDGTNQRIYIGGIATNIKAGDPLLFAYKGENDEKPKLHWVKSVTVEPMLNRTYVVLQAKAKPPKGNGAKGIEAPKQETVSTFIDDLVKLPTLQYANAKRLPRNLGEQFSVDLVQTASTNGDSGSDGSAGTEGGSDSAGGTGSGVADEPGHEKAAVLPSVLLKNSLAAADRSYAIAMAMSDVLTEKLPLAAANATVTESNALRVYAFKVKASPFGHNAPLRPMRFDKENGITEFTEWKIKEPVITNQGFIPPNQGVNPPK